VGFGTPLSQGEPLFGCQQDLFGLPQIGLGLFDLFPGKAGGLLGFLSTAFGDARLLPGRFEAALGFGNPDAGQLDFTCQPL
jgi:hypothetical protein